MERVYIQVKFQYADDPGDTYERKLELEGCTESDKQDKEFCETYANYILNHCEQKGVEILSVE